MKLYIKNMVCNRCKMVVKSVFESMGINPFSVELGEVELKNDINENQKSELLKKLRVMGFDLIDDKKSKTIGEIKTLIMSWYSMWFEISSDEIGTIAKIYISYLPPKEWYYKILSFFLQIGIATGV